MRRGRLPFNLLGLIRQIVGIRWFLLINAGVLWNWELLVLHDESCSGAGCGGVDSGAYW
jgi:hypothetical protein